MLIVGFLCACENIETPGQGLTDNSVGSATIQSDNSTANDSNDYTTIDSDIDVDKEQTTSSSTDSEVTDSSQDFWSQPDDIIYPYHFKTYEELIEAFSKENTESIIQVE